MMLFEHTCMNCFTFLFEVHQIFYTILLVPKYNHCSMGCLCLPSSDEYLVDKKNAAE